jgi:hypothetical protein
LQPSADADCADAACDKSNAANITVATNDLRGTVTKAQKNTFVSLVEMRWGTIGNAKAGWQVSRKITIQVGTT